MRPHVCDAQCMCPLHGKPLIYWPSGDEHACPVSSCPEFADGSSPWKRILRVRDWPRTHRPAGGPDEPAQSPPGRASASR